VAVDVETLLKRGARSAPGRIEQIDAIDVLREILSAGPQDADQIFREAKHAGVSEARLRKAKKELGVRSTRTGALGSAGRWTWALGPAKAFDNTSACPNDRLNNLSNNGPLTRPVSPKTINTLALETLAAEAADDERI
jgi:hypothetical protein